LGEFNAQGLANTAWAYAKLNTPAPRLFEAIAHESEQRVVSFKPQELANTAWAFATLGTPAPQLFGAIARASEQHIGSFKPQELANTAWAFATLGTHAPQLFDAIARESEQHICNFDEQGLANTAWAKQRIGGFKPQELANTAWAYATLGTPATQLFEAIARESEQRIGSFKPQGLANTAWAFAIAGTADQGALVEAVNARAAEIGLAAFGSKERRQLHQFFLGVELEASPSAELLAPIGLRDAEAVRVAMADYAGIVIEVDGPTHYDDERRLRPASGMIRHHLALAGWAVLTVPYWEWNALKGQARKAYLAELLASANL
ncbi:hypothetical protein T492DRAFT_582321, partial [Pavlovales sp. CCMP2436]